MRVYKYEFQPLDVSVSTPASAKGFVPASAFPDFGQEQTVPESAAPEEPDLTGRLLLSEEELDARITAARAEGHAEGLQTGLFQGRVEGRHEVEREAEEKIRAAISAHEAALLASENSILPHFAAIIAEIQETRHATIHTASTLALAIARKIAGKALSIDATKTIEHHLTDLLETLHTEPEITLTVAPALVGDFQARMDMLARKAGFNGMVHVESDDQLQLGDCTLRWHQGEAVRNQETLFTRLDEILARFLAQEEMDIAAAASLPETLPEVLLEVENPPAASSPGATDKKAASATPKKPWDKPIGTEF